MILAGVAITALTQTGLFENAKQAKNVMENAQENENFILGDYENTINNIDCTKLLRSSNGISE